MPVGWATAAAAAARDAPGGWKAGCVIETLCRVAISHNLKLKPEGAWEGVAASACLPACVAVAGGEGGRGLKENFPFEGDDREERLEMQCGSLATCCSYLGFRHDDNRERERDIHGDKGSKK